MSSICEEFLRRCRVTKKLFIIRQLNKYTYNCGISNRQKIKRLIDVNKSKLFITAMYKQWRNRNERQKVSRNGSV